MSLNCVWSVGYACTKGVNYTQRPKFVRFRGSKRSKTRALYVETKSTCPSVSDPVSAASPYKNFMKFRKRNILKNILSNSEFLNNRRGKNHTMHKNVN
jgi:hypothetical protein